MKTVLALFICYLVTFVSAFAQQETQEQLLQKYQAMVIIEELNQHCPILSRLEAEVLNGQIVFANTNFSGKLDKVEKFKKEARIFARRTDCHAPEIQGLIGLARQEANDSMINHILLSRQIHTLDAADKKEEKIPMALLLNFQTDDEWQLIDDFYEEVKVNYLEQAGQEAWGTFIDSIVKVAGEKTAKTFFTNDKTIKSAAIESIESVTATANNREITTYYYNLEKTVRAFIEGADAQKTGFPYLRPANDFTNWAAYRPRGENLNWVLSYQGCGGTWQDLDCTLFITQDGELGIVFSGEQEISDIKISYRNTADEKEYNAYKTVEAPIGSNMANEVHMKENIALMTASAGKKTFTALLSKNHDRYREQVGTKERPSGKVYIFPQEVLPEIENLLKNDMIKLTFNTKLGVDVNIYKAMIPVHNYHRAKNWAYAQQD